VESKARKRGGAASAPRAKRVTPGSKEGSKTAEKQDASAAGKKSAKTDEKAPAKKESKKSEASTTDAAKEDSSE